MPQTTVKPVYAAEYPILAKAQKPGGVTVLSVVSANDVPNKHTFVAGTIQLALFSEEDGEGRSAVKAEGDETEVEEENSEEESEEEAEPDPSPRSTRRGSRGRSHK